MIERGDNYYHMSENMFDQCRRRLIHFTSSIIRRSLDHHYSSSSENVPVTSNSKLVYILFYL
jgi:hypothetical protein